jgi:hypothetical protein
MMEEKAVWYRLLFRSSTMAIRQLNEPIEELARRGDELYRRQVRSQVEAAHKGSIVAIDVDTGDFGIGEDELAASGPLLAQRPDAQIWFVRVGSPTVHRIGTVSHPG